jgi:tetratricopeptide (TPR) repeat protein
MLKFFKSVSRELFQEVYDFQRTSWILSKPLTRFFVNFAKRNYVYLVTFYPKQRFRVRVNRKDHNIFHGITVSLTKHKIQKYQRQLGNGHDAELHLTIADLYEHLGQNGLALEAYKSAAESLLTKGTPLDTTGSNQLIQIYKQMLSLTPLDNDIANKLGQEYRRRGRDYRAVALHTSVAERYTQLGEYNKAIEQYQRVLEIEPSSITVRQICADLYCRLGEQPRGAREYMQIGDMYFEHQRFDEALKYYQRASDLHPDHDELKQKLLLTQQALEGTMIPQSVLVKNRQLQATQKRLDDLSAYVVVLKDNLEQIELEKQHLREQLDQELARKQDLERKLTRLSTLRMSDSGLQHPNSQSAFVQRLESAVRRLQREKTKLEQQLQAKFEQSLQRESQLRDHLADHTSRGKTLEQQLRTIQAQMNILETHDVKALEHLHGELSRQCELEISFSRQFHESLQEIAMLLQNQEQEIQKLTWRR